MSTIQFNEPKHLLNGEVFPCNLLQKKRLTVRGLCGYEHAGLPIKAITKPSAHVPITIQYFPIINGCRLIPNPVLTIVFVDCRLTVGQSSHQVSYPICLYPEGPHQVAAQ